jgi:hypothetical protein
VIIIDVVGLVGKFKVEATQDAREDGTDLQVTETFTQATMTTTTERNERVFLLAFSFVTQPTVRLELVGFRKDFRNAVSNRRRDDDHRVLKEKKKRTKERTRG